MASKIYWTIEGLILLVGLALNHYASQRMGLYRHLVYRRSLLDQELFATVYQKYWILAACLLILLALVAIYRTRRVIQVCYRFSWRVHWSLIASLALLEILLLTFFDNRSNFLMFPYFVLFIPAMACVNLIGCILIRIFHPNQKNCQIEEA
ncbi:hypothetical protein ACWODI_01350 [Facklamia languida]